MVVTEKTTGRQKQSRAVLGTPTVGTDGLKATIGNSIMCGFTV